MRSLVTMSLFVSFALGCNGKSTSTTPPPSSPTQADPDHEPAVDELCVHLMQIMRREFGDTGVTGVPLTDEERAKFLSSCAGDLEKEREKLGAESFDAYVACVLAAATMKDFIECDQSE